MEDVVDLFYRPLIRPLGNLVITFAQAEWSLVELLSECGAMGEEQALNLLKKPDAQKVAREAVSGSQLRGFELQEPLNHISEFWTDKEKRNRYIHDEWFPNILVAGGVAATRGIPRKSYAEITWDEPTPDDVWSLAYRFKEHAGAFSAGAYKIRKLRGDNDD